MQNVEMITTKQLNFILKLDTTKQGNELKELTKKQASIMIGKLLKNQKEENAPQETPKANNDNLYEFENNFVEFKELYYKKHFSYFKEKEYNSHFKYIVKLENELYYHIDTPSIETSFCYADDYDDYSNYNDPNNSWNECENARTNQEHFKRKNLEKLNRYIELFENESTIFVLKKNYSYSDNIVYLEQTKWYGYQDNPTIIDYHSGRELTKEKDYIRVLSKEDRETIIKAYKQVKKDFEKRITTYLKKYGLSKVRAWSYWAER